MLFGLAELSRGDCGDQLYLVIPGSIPPRALRRAVAVVSFTGAPDASTAPLKVFLDRAGTMAAEVSPGKATPVSSMPTCREKRGFDGNLFIVTEIGSGTVRFIADWRSGREVWFRPGTGAYRDYLWTFSFDPRRGHEAVDIFFRHDRVKLYTAPKRKAKYSYLNSGPRGEGTHQRSAFKVLSRRGAFIQIGEGGWEGQDLKPVGWIRLRDPSGALAVWPAYYDDC